MCQIAKIILSIHNYINIFLIYIRNMIKFITIPRKKKYAKIHPILESEYTPHTQIPSKTCYYDKSYDNISSMYYLNSKIVQYPITHR